MVSICSVEQGQRHFQTIVSEMKKSATQQQQVQTPAFMRRLATCIPYFSNYEKASTPEPVLQNDLLLRCLTIFVYMIGLAAFAVQTYIGVTSTTDQIVSKTTKTADPEFSCESLATPTKESGYNLYGYATNISTTNPLLCRQNNCFSCEIAYSFEVFAMPFSNSSACASETAATLSSFSGHGTWETPSDSLALGTFLSGTFGVASVRIQLVASNRSSFTSARDVLVADSASCVALVKSAEVFDIAVSAINITDSCTQYSIVGPFACSKVVHVHQPILQVLGSSIANSQMVVAVLALLTGYIIQFVASRNKNDSSGCSVTPSTKTQTDTNQIVKPE